MDCEADDRLAGQAIDNTTAQPERAPCTLVSMSIASHPDEPAGLTVLPPDEALERALPVPSAEDLEIEGLTDQEWTAFERALFDR